MTGASPLRTAGRRTARPVPRGLTIVAALSMTACTMAESGRPLGFSDLDGWVADDHAAALAAFRATCAAAAFPAARFPAGPPPGWAALCLAAASAPDPRHFFESAFRPVLSGDPAEALVTAYHEPVLDGARERGGRFTVPLHALPLGLPPGRPWLSRAEIAGGALDGRGLEIAWLADPVEAFFLQIQGSGRIRLPGGGTLRLGYAGRNGHPYRSIGRLLVERGELTLEEATADAIAAWLRADTARGARLMDENPSYVFFRELAGLPPEAGPVGTLGLPLTAGRSVAVDPAYHPLGLPVWIEAATPAGPFRRLMVAEDTGSAIRGPQRADLFLGTGAAAGVEAGGTRSGGRVIGLVPKVPAP